ncbi:S-layer homology domain-containing protein [Candidatus Peregrinibacteria bacterium]|nr:S-layer homology domain-containing protein [Candidatus Peregrinibacteria bacterium]
MKKYFSRWQEAFLIAGGSLLIALIAAQLQTPYFLKASLLSFGDFYKKGRLVSQEYGKGNQCWKSTGGDLIYDNGHTLQSPWEKTDIAECNKYEMRTGDYKRSDQAVQHWGEWDASTIGGSTYGSSGGGSNSSSSGSDGSSGSGSGSCERMEPSGNGSDMFVCYRNEGTGERKKLLGRNVPRGGMGWRDTCISECAGLPVSESVEDSQGSDESDRDDDEDERLHNASDEKGNDGDVRRDSSGDEWKRDAERWLKDANRNIESRQHELERNFRNSKADLAPAKDILSKWKAELDEMQRILGEGENSDVFQGLQRDADDLSQEVNDVFQKLYGVQRYENLVRQFKDREREISNMERSIKELSRQSSKESPVDTTELQKGLDAYRSQLKATQDKYNSVASTDPDLEDKMTDVEYELNSLGDASRDFWDKMNEINQKGQAVQQQADAQRVIKDKQKNMKDKERALKDLERRKKDSGALAGLLSQIKDQLSRMEKMIKDPAFDAQDFWDENSKFDELDRDFWDQAQGGQEDDRGQEDRENMSRSFKEKLRTLKDMSRQCKKSDCSSEAQDVLRKAEELYSQMEAAMKNGKEPQDFWDLNRDFEDLQQNFWEGMKAENEGQDMMRFLKDLRRELKDRGRFIEDLQREVKRGNMNESSVSAVVDIFKKMQQTVDKAEKAAEAKDFESMRDLLETDFNDLRQQFEDASESLNGSREIQFAKKELERAEHEVARAEKRLKQLVKSGRFDEARAEVCQGYLDEGRSLLKNAMGQLDKGDAEALAELEDKANTLAEDSDRDCGELDEGRPDFEGFNEVYVDQPNRGISKDILDRISADVAERVLEHLGRNSMVFNNMLEKKLGERFKDQIAKTLEATSSVDDAAVSEDILNQKAAILEQIQEMEALTAKLEGLRKLAHSQLEELRALQDEIASYNFIGDSGSDIQDEIERFMAAATEGKGDVNADDIKALREEAKQAIEKAREEKFKKGVIAFKDADDNVWFGKYAKMAKEKGWVKGTGESGYTRVNPDAPTNVAEAVIMLGRMAGADESSKETPDSVLGKRLPEWARAGAAALEKAGVNLDMIFGRKKADGTVSRAEVARMLQILLKLAPGDASSFEDINEAASEEERDAIGAVNTAGIMTGQGDGSKFDPRGPLNRAALMKILTEAAAKPVRE